MHIYDLNCKGSENNLFECMYNSSSLRSCNHQTAQQAAVLCQPIEGMMKYFTNNCGSTIFLIAVMNSNCSSGDLRIRNESKDVRGRLELCDNRVWFSMVWHPSYWSDEPWNKELVCTSLGHRSIGRQCTTQCYCYYYDMSMLQILNPIQCNILIKSTFQSIHFMSSVHRIVKHSVQQVALGDINQVT